MWRYNNTVALFPGSPHARFFVLQVTERWAGAGNEANSTIVMLELLLTTLSQMHVTAGYMYIASVTLIRLALTVVPKYIE